MKGGLELQVHVDDPCASGRDDHIDWLFDELEKHGFQMRRDADSGQRL